MGLGKMCRSAILSVFVNGEVRKLFLLQIKQQLLLEVNVW